MKTALLLMLTLSISAMDLVATLKQEEGFRANVYKCSEGYSTIGYGHRCAANHPAVTKAQAEAILAADIAKARARVGTLVGKDAPQEVKNLLTCMTFQLGHAGVCGFKGMLASIKAKDYKGASKHMLDSKWARQTPARAKRMASLVAAVK